MESSESMPPRSEVFMGTPMMGSGVNAATTPPRWAALPAAAMMTLRPRSAAEPAHSWTLSGLRCALAMTSS